MSMTVNADRLILEVGRRVAELRSMNGITQAVLAEEIGVSIQYIQRIEAGQENLTLKSLAGLANVLEVEVVSLFQTPISLDSRRGRPPADR